MAKKFILRKTTLPAQGSPSAAPRSPGEWFHSRGAAIHGPCSQAELKYATAAGGTLSPDGRVWRTDNPAQVPAGCIPWLFPDARPFEEPDTDPVPALTCPACHASFPPEDALFIAQHPDLPQDLLLGPGHAYRFRPSRFVPEGAAVDPLGETSIDTACPSCHTAMSPQIPADSKPAPMRPAPRDKSAPERLPPVLSTPEGVRKLVAEIRGILTRSGSARSVGDVVARQYAELCRRANARLALCQEFIRRGAISAAYDQAEQAPRLLELCADLPFPDLDQWGQLCARSRWALASAIDTSAVEELQACCLAAAPLEPVLQAFRRAVRRGRPEDSLRLLRTLWILDPGNDVWQQDVRTFESARQGKLFEDAEAAIHSNDLAALTPAARELLGPWASPPDPETLGILEAEFSRMRAEDAVRRGADLARQFAEACAVQDFAAAQAADAAYRALLAEGLFKPEADTLAAIESGRAWFEAETALHQANSAFAADLAALQAALDRPGDGETVERLLDTLRATGREIPPAARDAADRIVRQRRFRIALRRRLRLAGRVAAVVVPLLLVGIGIGRVALGNQRRSCCARLEQALRTDNLPAFDGVLEEMRQGTGRLFGGALTRYPPLAARIARRAELAARVQGRDSAYQRAIAGLQHAQAHGFDAPAVEVLGWIEGGNRAAKTLDQVAAIAQIETAWRADQRARLDQALTQLASVAPPAADLYATRPFAAATQEVARYCAQVDAAQGLLGAPAAEREKLAPVAAIASLCKSNLAARLSLLQTAGQAVHLDAYLDALVRYADRFTNDTLSVGLGTALDSRKQYRAALQSQFETQERPDAAAWIAARKAILDLRATPSLNDLRWVRRKDTGETAFVMGREKTEAGFRGTWAEAYTPLSGDKTPVFKRARITDDPLYNQGLSDQPSRPWRHTEWINDIVSRVVAIDRPAEGARFIEEQIRMVGNLPVWNGVDAPGTNDLPNVAFQVQFLVFFVEPMTRLSSLPEWQQMRTLLRNVDVPEANWICLKNGDVRRIDREGGRELRRIFGPTGLIACLDVRRAAQALTRQTPLVWAGWVDFGAPDQAHWKMRPPPEEACVLRPDPRHGMLLVRAGRPGAWLLPLIPGEPLLAWSDGAPTARRTAELARAFPQLDAATLIANTPAWYPHDP